MNVTSAKLSEKDEDLQNPIPLVYPDMGGDFGIRYIWLKNRENNQSFVENYFSDGNQLGMNMRTITSHLVEEWKKHNQIFMTGRETGDLICRIKIFNPVNMSIDHIEVWRNVDTIVRLFEANRYKEESHLRELGNALYDNGFSIHMWYPYPTMSREQVIEIYDKFVEMHKAKQNCKIEASLKLP